MCWRRGEPYRHERLCRERGHGCIGHGFVAIKLAQLTELEYLSGLSVRVIRVIRVGVIETRLAEVAARRHGVGTL